MQHWEAKRLSVWEKGKTSKQQFGYPSSLFFFVIFRMFDYFYLFPFLGNLHENSDIRLDG